MRAVLGLALLVLVLGYINADQRKRDKPDITKGIVECRRARRRGYINYGTSVLKEARIQKEDKKGNLKEIKLKDGVFELKSGAKYVFKVKFLPKRYPEGFGARPKNFAVKITENVTFATPGQESIFQNLYGRPAIGKHECSTAFTGRSEDSEGCKYVTANSQVRCPMKCPEDDGNPLNECDDDGNPMEVEMEFTFNVPNFPGMKTFSKFRLIPTEAEKIRGTCDQIGLPGGTETTIDVDMICFKYPTLITN